MNKALVDYYRCPASLIPFELSGKLSSGSTSFRFDGIAPCYGQVAIGSPAGTTEEGLPDLSPHIVTGKPALGLPFHPSHVVDNLRRERYPAARARAKVARSSVQSLYYHLRPVLGIPIRKHVQRLFFRARKGAAFPAWPVDTTVDRLMETLLRLSMRNRKLGRIPFIWFWPNGASGCATVTHDVESVAGADFVPQLMDLDEEFGIPSSFQIIPEKQYTVDRNFLTAISGRGFEINVQDLTHDGNLFSDRETFLVRARSINRYVREWHALGFRAGRMYRNVDWYDALDISYDMSVPNSAHFDPQGGGCCTVFPYFLGRILELPLTTTQDYTLFHILGDYSTDFWKTQSALILEKHGLATFLVHPDYIRDRAALQVYRNLLEYISGLRDEEGVWLASPSEVNSWWRQRRQMTLLHKNGEWMIEGPGRERARIAWASVEDDRIVYTVEQSAGSDSSEGHNAVSLCRKT